MPEHVRAPWSLEAALALNTYQFGGTLGHPYTCPHRHKTLPLGTEVRLVAMVDGWHCPIESCDYRQDWAHARHAKPEHEPVACPMCRGSDPEQTWCTCKRWCGSDFCRHEPDPVVAEARLHGTSGPHAE